MASNQPSKNKEYQSAYKTKLFADRRTNGLCQRCGKSRERLDLVECDTCRAKGRATKASRKNSGLCSACGMYPAIVSKVNCERCSLNSRLCKLKLSSHEKDLIRRALKEFQSVCNCCGATSPGSIHDWAIDHDHKTMKFRGFICHPCNLALGHMHDDIGKLKKLISYLERFIETGTESDHSSNT